MFRLRLSHLREYRDLLCDAGECLGQHARRRDHYRGRQSREAAPPATSSAQQCAAIFTATRDFNADAGATFSGSIMVGIVIASGSEAIQTTPSHLDCFVALLLAMTIFGRLRQDASGRGEIGVVFLRAACETCRSLAIEVLPFHRQPLCLRRAAILDINR
jgi:hypothetical protein